MVDTSYSVIFLYSSNSVFSRTRLWRAPAQCDCALYWSQPLRFPRAMAPVTVADGIDPSDRSDEASASSAHQPVDEKKGPVIVDVTEEDEKRVGSIASAIHDVAEHDSEAKMAAVVDPRMKDYPIPMVAMTVGLDDNPACDCTDSSLP